MRSIMTTAAAATFAVLASAGLGRGAPIEVMRGQVDLSSPYIPPARRKQTAAEKRTANAHMARAEAKRQRKAAILRALVAKGALQAI